MNHLYVRFFFRLGLHSWLRHIVDIGNSNVVYDDQQFLIICVRSRTYTFIKAIYESW